MELPPPWSPVVDAEEKAAFEAELEVETRKGHPLFGLFVRAIGRRYDQDKVLFELRDGSGRVAEVHLTWGGKKEKPPTPDTSVHPDLATWATSVR